MNQGISFALASAVLFGMSTPLAKTLVGTASPLMLAGLLYAGSGLGLALVIAVRRLATQSGLSSSPLRVEDWRWLAAAIFFGGVVAPAALMYGLVTSAASSASLLLNLEAVFTALIAWFLFRENFDRRIALGMLAIVGGGALLAWTPGAHAEASLGPLLIVAACLCWALDNNLTRRVSGSDAMLVACIKGLVAAAVNIALALLIGLNFPAPGVLSAAALVGFFGYGVSLVLFVLALRHLGTARTGAYFSVAPFFGAALALLLQGDPITWQLVIAALLMAGGVWLHLTEHHEHLHAHAAQEHSHPPLVHSHRHYPDWHHRHPH